MTTDLSNICSAIDCGNISQDDDDVCESQYSRLENEANALRLENQRLRDAIGTINCALDALNLRSL